MTNEETPATSSSQWLPQSDQPTPPQGAAAQEGLAARPTEPLGPTGGVATGADGDGQAQAAGWPAPNSADAGPAVSPGAPGSPTATAVFPPLAVDPGNGAGAHPYGSAGTAQPQPKGQRGRVAGLLASAAAIALLAGAVGGFAGYRLADGQSPLTAIAASPAGTGTSPAAEGSIAAIAEAVTPAVVNIEATSGSQGGTGSGFVITSDGYIVTNNHVVDGARSISVIWSDGTREEAELVGADSGYDLAVLKVDRNGLPTVQLGSSGSTKVGDTAIAVGSPLGLSGTVTTGIISALDRPVTAGGGDSSAFINAIQTDAAINPGNSGGPLLNGSGEVIGVNSAIATLGGGLGGQSGSIGLGFAIPIDTASRIVDEIISTGSAQTPVIGVQIQDSEEGPQVGEVTPGGPAEAAGLEAGDIITEVNGREVSDSTELIVAIRAYAVGDVVTLTVDSGGDVREVDVKLAARSQS